MGSWSSTRSIIGFVLLRRDRAGVTSPRHYRGPGRPGERGRARLAAIRHPGVVGVHALGVALRRGRLHGDGARRRRSRSAHHLDRLGRRHADRGAHRRALLGDQWILASAAIHRAGISHGDIKPDNILLAATGRVVLMDLGLVRARYEPDQQISSPGRWTSMAFEICRRTQLGTRAPPSPIPTRSASSHIACSRERSRTRRRIPSTSSSRTPTPPVPKLSDAVPVPAPSLQLVSFAHGEGSGKRSPGLDGCRGVAAPRGKRGAHARGAGAGPLRPHRR